MILVDEPANRWSPLGSRPAGPLRAVVGAHDARLVAAMVRHSISHLLTFNEQDFARYNEIAVIVPSAAAAFPPAGP